MSLHVRGNARNIGLKENQNRAKDVSQKPSTRRTALGNVTNQIRKQPQRIAKDKHSVLPSKAGFSGQENVPPPNSQKPSSSGMSFNIFEDAAPAPARPLTTVRHEAQIKEESMLDQENLIPEEPLVLRDIVAGLNRNNAFPAIARQLQVPDLDGSPMLIDSIKEDREASICRPDEFGLDPYNDDIYNYLRAVEPASRPERTYMRKQTDVSTSMRNILVDWLVEVGEEYKLQRETLFLAISYIDRFLSLVGVHRPKLQLVGAASMFIAAKYEEIYPPDVAEFVYITDDTYTRSQVLKMESVILKLLNFKVAVPTINWFCERFLDLLEMTEKAKSLTHFLTELSLIEVEEFLDFRPSVIAASAIVLARSTLDIKDPWPANVEKFSGYSLSSLNDCVQCLFRLYSRKSTMPQQAVIEKYKQEKFQRVALVEPPAVLAIH
ncbi:G2/mitotic-specific cyclin-A [Biomphalaria glabrata]|uniref:G2/mitotic-specific cyclin-A-like n=1 Tax=Biomphalaria glabrata TaxID=6526 RepID=A0A2C9M5X9_BIOGL|nr:G2/mitotic-specific cyclin-A-like [Biomphalaria glabrata]XP_013075280.1 G2/mitotic-specific cyclin-A-like [Biomphalaria glabrata]KAI8756976.1 G2/mitotic-specific cyclin-A-like [Biomphalaria glabrata]